MAGTPLQKRKLAVKMANYFTNKGYIGTPQEFKTDSNRPELVTISTIKRIFGAWSIMVKFTTQFTDTAESMKGLTIIKPEPKPVVKPAKPAKKAEKEGVHGKDI